jgi:hypothetical protein
MKQCAAGYDTQICILYWGYCHVLLWIFVRPAFFGLTQIHVDFSDHCLVDGTDLVRKHISLFCSGFELSSGVRANFNDHILHVCCIVKCLAVNQYVISFSFSTPFACSK